MLKERWISNLSVLLVFFSVSQFSHAQVGSQAPKSNEIILDKAGIAFTLSEDYYEYKERGIDGFLFSATDGKGFNFQISLPDSPEVEARSLKEIQDKVSGFVWNNDMRIGNHSYICYHHPQFLSWYFWLRSSNRSIVYLYFIPRNHTGSAIPPEAMRILSSIRTLDNVYVVQNQSARREILLKDLGIAFTLPGGFTQYDAELEHSNALFVSMKACNGLVFMVRRPDDASVEAYILEKIKRKNSGFIGESDVRIGDNSYFFYHQPLFSGWYYWLRSPKGSVAYLYFVPLEPTDTMPPEALEILTSIRLLK